MEEDDFVLSGEEENGSGKMQELAMSKSQEGSLTFRDTVSMSTKEKRKLMTNQHPEIIPVISHFSDFIKEGIETNVATQVMTQAGNMVEVSYCVIGFVELASIICKALFASRQRSENVI